MPNAHQLYTKAAIAAGLLTISTTPFPASSGTVVEDNHAQIPAVWVDGETMPATPSVEAAANRALKLNASASADALHITLPRTDGPTQATNAGGAEPEPEPGAGPFQVGFHRHMPRKFRNDLSPRLDWNSIGNGAVASVVKVTSPGASDMRMGIHVELPAGGEMRFFGSDASRRFPVTTRADIGWKGNEPRIVWSPVVEGDTIGVEVVLRSREALSTFSFRIEAISHGTTPQSSIREQSGTSASRLTCSNHIDAQCRFNYSPVGGNNAVNAVARLRYEKGGFSYSCSGTLIVDGDTSNYVPYLLTAHHCIATQEVANTVVASWFYQYESCGSTAIDRRHADTTGGADLLATNPNQDSTLLRFRRRISGEQIFSGWTTQNWPGQWNHGFHHPRGGVKKFSAGRMTKRDSAEVCDDPEKSEDCITVSNAIEVDILPNRGTSEPGSSGSGLFLSRTDHTDYLMGVLSGSRGSCTDRIVSYGSFRHFFPQISRWIDTNPGPPWTPIGEDDDHGDTLAEATRVSVPSLTGGNIEHVGDYDYFLVDLTDRSADVRVNLRVHTTGPTDTYGTLFDSAGTALGTNNDGGLDNNFLIERQVQAGTYYVEVRGYDDATGGYMLETAISRDEDDHGNIPGEGTLVSIPSTTLGRLDPPGDVDYFRIEPQQDGMLQVETTGGIDTLGQLVGSGVDIEDDNSGAGDNFRFVAEVRAAATYIPGGARPFRKH